MQVENKKGKIYTFKLSRTNSDSFIQNDCREQARDSQFIAYPFFFFLRVVHFTLLIHAKISKNKGSNRDFFCLQGPCATIQYPDV